METMREMSEMNGGQAGASKPPVTERRYVRENVAMGGTRAGRDNAMTQALMGGGGENAINQAAMEGG